MPRSTTLSFKIWMILFFILGCAPIGQTQPLPPNQQYIDSITAILTKLPNDRIKVDHLVTLARMHSPSKMTLALGFAKEGLKISEKINYTLGKINCLGSEGFCHALMGEWPKATMEVNQALPLCKNEYRRYEMYMYNVMFIVAATKGEKDPVRWAKKIVQHPDFASSSDYEKWPTYMQLGVGYDGMNQLDSAEHYSKILKVYVEKYASWSPDLTENCYYLAGSIALKRKHYTEALFNFRLAKNTLGIAKTFIELGQADSVLYYGLKSLHEAQKRNIPIIFLDAAKLLAKYYSKSNPAEANRYLNLYIDKKDELYNAERIKQFEQIRLTEQQSKFDLQQKVTSFRNRWIVFGLIALLFILGIIAYILWRNNRYRRSANKVLQGTLLTLKSTQAQLIQSEKLASLGELTAGIAHEIQNPLNFVNNFAEVSAEILDDLKADLQNGKTTEAIEIADDLQINLQKINHHGQRASSIVKGMLEHSRTSTGVKEPTDLNELADEFLRLAYHGLRAKDSSFNATMETHFDPDLPKISVIPQDIGRVLLNLINNAFYAVNQRKNARETLQATSLPYQPTVTVTTKKLENAIQIIVQDNGNGIPDSIKDKIFQPFFTTKPSGQGTGLGLSLAYDIIKAHGGTLEVHSLPEESSTFIIVLPN